MTVLEMVKEYLNANGFDGLVHRDCACACLLDDLVPCDEVTNSCEAGHRVEGCHEECENYPDGDWHVVAGKPADKPNVE